MGATGYTTGLAPSMSLGCGAYAGNITSDNITSLHLMNIKRLAYERPRSGADSAGPDDLRAKVAAFVESRVPAGAPTPAPAAAPPPPAAPRGDLLDFVCEDDVRRALREGRVLRLSAKAIVTPSARDAASGKDVLVRTDDGS
jgi:acetaldehyde dehydrogenase (acetylating)